MRKPGERPSARAYHGARSQRRRHPTQWSLSRPLLALILTNESFYHEWRDSIVGQQAGDVERQRKLAAAFDKLMSDISVSLEAKNRDRFTHNLTCFRHQIKELL